jgi:hypothetical protein
MLTLLREVDAQLVVNASALPRYAQEGIPAFYWQIGYEPVNTDNLPDAPAYDVLFQGNCYSPARAALGKELQALRDSGYSVGIYGRGWAQHGIEVQGDSNYNYPLMWALNANARVVISDNQFPQMAGFVSNRLINALAAGALVLQQEVKSLEALTGFKAGEHYLQYRVDTPLAEAVEAALKLGKRKQGQMRKRAREYVQSRYGFDALLNELWNKVLPTLADRNA